ncbi:MAG: Tfp pilus assembly protein FimT/FimU [Planctomycetota bacterium]
MKRRGYTLIELILVVTILGIAGALLIPNLSSRGDLDTQAAVRTLVADIAFAQSDALARQEYRRVQFLPNGRGWALVEVEDIDETFDESTAEYVLDPLNRGSAGNRCIVDLERGGRFSSVRVVSAAFDGTTREYFTFDELGGTVYGSGLPGTGGKVVLESPEATYEVVIAPLTGKVTVRRVASAVGG